MKITITGASGFVGQNLSKSLQNQNHDVQTLSLRNSWVLDKNSDAIIHLAGKAHDTANTSADEEYFKINRDLTILLFEEFLNSDEKYLLSQQLPENKRLFIIRPCMIHGPGNKGNLNLLYKVVEKGFPYPLAAFDNERSFLSIKNLNYLVLQLIENKNIPSGIYNFADDDFVSTNALIAIISKAIGKKPKLLKIPKIWIQAAAKTGDFLHLPLNTERLTKLTENYRVSNQKIKKALGIAKLPISAEEGMLTTIQSFTKQK